MRLSDRTIMFTLTEGANPLSGLEKILGKVMSLEILNQNIWLEVKAM